MKFEENMFYDDAEPQNVIVPTIFNHLQVIGLRKPHFFISIFLIYDMDLKLSKVPKNNRIYVDVRTIL